MSERTPRQMVGEQVGAGVPGARRSRLRSVRAIGRYNLLIGTKAVDPVSGTGIAPLVSIRDPTGRTCLLHPQYAWAAFGKAKLGQTLKNSFSAA